MIMKSYESFSTLLFLLGKDSIDELGKPALELWHEQIITHMHVKPQIQQRFSYFFLSKSKYVIPENTFKCLLQHVDQFPQSRHQCVNIATVITVLPTILSDSKVHGANMGPTWVLSAPGGSHVGPMNLAIWAGIQWKSHTRLNLLTWVTSVLWY